jgi:hypothetical protein
MSDCQIDILNMCVVFVVNKSACGLCFCIKDLYLYLCVLFHVYNFLVFKFGHHVCLSDYFSYRACMSASQIDVLYIFVCVFLL